MNENGGTSKSIKAYWIDLLWAISISVVEYFNFTKMLFRKHVKII